MRLDNEFNVDDMPQGGGYDLLPDGWYSAKVTGAELKNTKNGLGKYIAVKYLILGPTHQGRVMFGNINIKNANPKAEEIGLAALRDLQLALGIPRLRDTDQLIGGDVQIKIKTRPPNDGYEAQNDIGGFKPLENRASTPPPPQNNDYAVASGKSSPPWRKNNG
jgi:hypothetical protein